MSATTLTIALSKGKLLPGTEALFRRSGLPFPIGDSRRLVVAAPAGSGFSPDKVAHARVATKYPRVTTAYFLGRGLAVEVVKLQGSVEIAPGLGLADCIVDIVETGRTLLDNGLEVRETVAESSARFVVNRASYHARREDVAQLIKTLRGAPS